MGEAMSREWSRRFLRRIGLNLYRLRTEAGMSRAELEKIAGVSEHTLGNWERGSRAPTIDRLAHLSVRTGWSLAVILGAKKKTAGGGNDELDH